MQAQKISKRFFVRPLAVAVAVTLSGCSLFDDIFDGGKTYRGVVSFGFEVSSFAPCGGDQQWWVTNGEALLELQARYNDLVEFPYTLAYAELKGKRSRIGEYGHLGAYQREFEVAEVVEVRELSEGECGQ